MTPLKFFGIMIAVIILLPVIYVCSCKLKEHVFNHRFIYLRGWVRHPKLHATEQTYRDIMHEWDDLEPFTTEQKKQKHELLCEIMTKFREVIIKLL